MDINLILEEIEANHCKYKNGEIIYEKNKNQYSDKLLKNVIAKAYKYFELYNCAVCEEDRINDLLDVLKDKDLKSHLTEEKEVANETGKKYSELTYQYVLQSIFILLGVLDYIDDEYIETYDCPNEFFAIPTFDIIKES